MGFFAGDEVPDYFLAGSCSKRADGKKKNTARYLVAPAFSISKENGMYECCSPDSASAVRFPTFEPRDEKTTDIKKAALFVTIFSDT